MLGSKAIANQSLRSEIQRNLSLRYPNAEIQIFPDSKIPVQVAQVGRIQENRPGEIDVEYFQTSGEKAQTIIRFEAQMAVWVAKRRYGPGQVLNPSDFDKSSIDVSRGIHREYRSLLVSNKTDLNKMETTQSILEGQPLRQTVIQKVPDIRRGDLITIKIHSPGLNLVTLGVAQQPGNINDSIRVLTQAQKKELVGRITHARQLEVKL